MRLIDANALIKEIQNVYEEEKSEDPRWAIGLRHSKRIVRDMQTVDAVMIVRCKDCKHCYVDGENVRFNVCELDHNKVQSGDWFCADGERKEGR